MMGATPISQLKREALAGLQYHPDDLKAVSAACFAKHLPTIKQVQVAAAPVLADQNRRTPTSSKAVLGLVAASMPEVV
jgi:hypothetical protein